jgi:hypothetical protein
MNLFNYIYYRVTRYYKQFSSGDGYFLMGVVVLSILQFFNLVAILAFSSSYVSYIKQLFITVKEGNNRTLFIIFISLLLFYNYLNYTKLTTYSKLDSEWNYKPLIILKRYNYYVLVYLLISLIMLILSSKLILTKI